MDQLVLFIISLLANLFSAFSGGGAGLVQLPALIFLGLPFGVALATHKVASVALGLGATLRHRREGSLERQFVIFLLATGIPGVIIGASLILNVPDRAAEIALGCLTLGLGIYSTMRKKPGTELSVAPPGYPGVSHRWHCPVCYRHTQRFLNLRYGSPLVGALVWPGL